MWKMFCVKELWVEFTIAGIWTRIHLCNHGLTPWKGTKLWSPPQTTFVTLGKCRQPLQFPIYDVGYHYP